MDNERDLVVFTDDNGDELTLEVLDYFFYNGQEYAVLSDSLDDDEESCDEEACAGCECGCDHGDDDDPGLYIMKVIPIEDDQEEFAPVEEELMDELIKIVQQRFDEDEDEIDDTVDVIVEEK